MKFKNIKEIIDSEDPLCEEAIEFLFMHKEEDLYIDYKQDFDQKSEKDWLGMTIDALSFANTHGGYLIFGIEDSTFDLKGINTNIARVLSNSDLISQKLNRYILPPFRNIRSKKITREGKNFVIIYIPETVGKTHIVVKEGSFKFPNGKRTKPILRVGAVYIRRSGGNQIIDPGGLEFIINKRIDYFRDLILNKIARVIEAPPQHQVLVFDPDKKTDDTGEKFVITNAPDAIPVKGMSFTIAPQTDEQEVASWIALSSRDPKSIPGKDRLWELYARRKHLNLSLEQEVGMAKFSLRRNVPSFYWVRRLELKDVKKTLIEALKICENIDEKANIIEMDAFWGKGFHARLIKIMGEEFSRLAPRSRKIPRTGPLEYFSPNLIEVAKVEYEESQGSFEQFLESKLTEIAEELAKGTRDYYQARRARAFDCFLYSGKALLRPE